MDHNFYYSPNINQNNIDQTKKDYMDVVHSTYEEMKNA
jgi:hypothetical protein